MTTLEFGEEKLFFIIHSKKFDCEIDRTLEYLDLELEDIPLEMLRNIKYPFSFSLGRDKFLYTIKNVGKYSEIVYITADNTNDEKAVIFSEIGQYGKGEVNWKKNNLPVFQFDTTLIEIELKTTENEKSKEFIEKILNEQKCSSAHSISFLAWLVKLANVLEKDDTIGFSIRDDHPIKVAMQFRKLGISSLQYFLAPRTATQDEIDDDEEFDDI